VETYLVTVTEGEVLHTDVLVRVLGALLERGHVLPVLPVLVPEVVGVETTANQAGNNSAVRQLVSVLAMRAIEPLETYKMDSLRQRSGKSLG
jgi:hypothetical protein